MNSIGMMAMIRMMIVSMVLTLAILVIPLPLSVLLL